MSVRWPLRYVLCVEAPDPDRDTPDRSDAEGPATDHGPDFAGAEPHAHEIGNRTYLIADVEPLDVTGVRTVAAGTALFALAGLALLPFHGWLVDTGREWWLWTCLAGFGLGLFGFDYCRRRARHRH